MGRRSSASDLWVVRRRLSVTSTSFALIGDECSGGLQRGKKILFLFVFLLVLCKCWWDEECKLEGTNLTPRSERKTVRGTCWTLKTFQETLCWGRWVMVGQGGWSAPPLPQKKVKSARFHFANIFVLSILFWNADHSSSVILPIKAANGGGVHIIFISWQQFADCWISVLFHGLNSQNVLGSVHICCRLR